MSSMNGGLEDLNNQRNKPSALRALSIALAGGLGAAALPNQHTAAQRQEAIDPPDPDEPNMVERVIRHGFAWVTDHLPPELGGGNPSFGREIQQGFTAPGNIEAVGQVLRGEKPE